MKTLLSDPKNQLLLSAASAWELVVKIQTGKLKLPQPVGDYLPARLAYYSVEVLPLRLDLHSPSMVCLLTIAIRLIECW